MDGFGHFLHSKESVTQGDPLAMIAYKIGILLFICEICGMHPQVTHTWYADDAGAGGKLYALQDHMKDMMGWGPP